MGQAVFERIYRLRGSVVLGGSAERLLVLDNLRIALENQGKQIESRSNDEIQFGAPMFGLFHSGMWDTLAIFHAGRLRWIDSEDLPFIAYDLTSSRTMVVAALLALTGAAAFSWQINSWWGLLFCPFIFAWLYGVNLAIASQRVPGFLERAMRA